MPMHGMEGARQHYVEYNFKENVRAPLDEVEVVDGKVAPKKIEYTMMEEKKMIIAIVIGVSCLFWIIAAILFVCAKGVDRRISKSKKDCVEKTTATVVDVEEVYKRNVDTYNYTWYPAYEFYVNGERVVQKSVIGTGKNSVQTGQQTILYYNPENPHMIYVPAENQTSVSTILKIIGIAFVICGCLVGIIGFVVSKNM